MMAKELSNMNHKPFETPWQLFWCADAADERLLHVSESVSSVLGMTPGALMEDPLQWNHAVLPADAAALPRPFFAETVPHAGDQLREYRMLGADLHLYQVRERRYRWRDPVSGRLHIFGLVEGVQELRRPPDEPVEPSWEHLWAHGDNEPSRSGSVPRTPDPAKQTDDNADDPGPPSHVPDDPGVPGEGPKRYHDDYGSTRRMSSRGRPFAVSEPLS
ncbi:hypothetical protein CDN98_05725 [Roseateles terrae]|nr:hypothetical protein CDN98_05725 [Roseateles terrae]